MLAKPSTRSLILLLVLPYLLLVAIKIGLAQGLDTPLKVDELGYLGNARYLATGDGLVDATGRASYKVGYSLFLVPAFWGERGPVEAFKAVQVINAFLLSLVFPLALALAGRLRPELSLADRAIVAGCVSVYPAALLYATSAMSANVFIPCFFAYCLAAHRAIANPASVTRWAAWGLIAGLLYGIHERALGALGVAVLAALVATTLRLRRRHWLHAWPPLALVASLAATNLIVQRLAPPGATWKTSSKGTDIVLHAISQPGRLWTTFVGQFWYIVLATAGVLVIAALYRGLAARNRQPPASTRSERKEDRSVVAFGLVVLAAAGSVFALSVLFMAQRPNARFSHWIYGRYNDGVLLPILLLALLALWEPGGRLRRRSLAAAGAGAAAVLLALTMMLDALWHPGVGGPFSFSGVGAFALGQTPLGWGVLRSSALALAVLAVVGFLLAWRWRAGILALACYFVIGTVLTYSPSWQTRYRVAETQRSLVDVIRRLDPEPRRIYHVPGSLPYHFHYYNLSYFLPDFDFRPLPRSPDLRDGDLVLGGRRLGFGRNKSKARIVALENLGFPGIYYRQALWVLPGVNQDRLAKRGWLLPTNWPTPIPRAALDANLTLAGPSKLRAQAGGTLPLALGLEHRGSMPWVNTSGMRTRTYSVGVEARWIQKRKAQQRDWIPLPRTLYPNDQVEIVKVLSVPSRPGRYRLLLTVTQLLEDENPRRGNESLTLKVEVSP